MVWFCDVYSRRLRHKLKEISEWLTQTGRRQCFPGICDDSLSLPHTHRHMRSSYSLLDVIVKWRHCWRQRVLTRVRCNNTHSRHRRIIQLTDVAKYRVRLRIIFLILVTNIGCHQNNMNGYGNVLPSSECSRLTKVKLPEQHEPVSIANKLICLFSAWPSNMLQYSIIWETVSTE